MSKEEKKLECVWNTGGECSGEVKEERFFNDQITVPVCVAHKTDHENIIFLSKHGHDIEDILEKTPECRKDEVAKIKSEQGEQQ